MGTIKEGERGAQRVLYSVSQQLDDGWLVTEVVSRVTFTPHDLPQTQRPIRSMEQGDGRGSDRRQTTLPWYQKEQQGGARAPEATAPTTAQEGTSWLEGLGDPPSFGYRSQRQTESTVRPQPKSALKTEDSNSESKSVQDSTQVSPRQSRSSKTSRKISPKAIKRSRT